MPDTLLGLLLLVAAAAPGAVYVRTMERYVPRREPNEIRQVAELVLVGAATTTVALTIGLSLISALQALFPATFDINRLQQFSEAPVPFLATNWRSAIFALIFIAAILGGSVVFAHIAARIIARGRPARINPNHGTWYEAIGVWQDTHHVFATLQLENQEFYSGYVRSVPMDDESGRALVLKRNIFRRPNRTQPEEELLQDYLVVPIARVRLAGLELRPKPA